MSRTSLIIGIVLSIVVHALLMLTGRWGKPAARPEPELVATTLVVPELPPETEPEPEPEPLPEPKQAEPTPEAAPEPDPVPARSPVELSPITTPPLDLVETALALVPDIPDMPDLSPVAAPAPRDEPDDDAIPGLRVTWDGPGQLRSVAAELEMRVIALDADGEVLGEVALSGDVRIEPFRGSFGDYSNRVRTLPRRFFGSTLATPSGRPIVSFWILVPVPLDRHFAKTVRRAIDDAGVRIGDVDWVEAGFVPGPSGPRLVVTRIET